MSGYKRTQGCSCLSELPDYEKSPLSFFKSKKKWLHATLHNTGWIDHCHIRHWSFETIPFLDAVDVEAAYSHITSHHRCLQWHVRSHRCGYMTITKEFGSMDGRLLPGCEVPSAKLSKYFADVAPTMGVLLICSNHFNHFRKVRSLWNWDQGLVINPEDKTSHTTQYQEAFLKYVEKEYYAKHRLVQVDKPNSIPCNTLGPSRTASE